MFERQEALIGKNKNDIENVTILLVGIGGVGGSCFEMLVRLGFKHIYIADYDYFEESNLNRQILSNSNNIGEKKVEVAKFRAKEINNDCLIEIIDKKIDKVFLDGFTKKVDYIIDACDDISAKIELVKYAIKNNIKIISSMGMGNRVDPLKLEIDNIWKTKNDPLAKKMRYLLKKENIKYKLPVVFSNEIPIKSKEKIFSICLVPNTAGILLAGFVLKDILNNN